MESKTKVYLTDDVIKNIFINAKIDGVLGIAPLGAGEFNAVYLVKTKDKEYVLKIAPTAEVLDYEKGMMKAEVYWYEQMRNNTDIRVPDVYFYDDSKKIIPTEYFIMEKIEGTQLNKIELSDEEKSESIYATCKMAAKIHNVHSDKFGYIQNGLYDNWYSAIKSMTLSLIKNCEEKGKKTKRGYKLLNYIEQYKDVLMKAESCMVNFDIWLPNIMVQRNNGKLEYAWIDPERCFWGDRVADFMCLDWMSLGMDKKDKAIKVYNTIADKPIEATKEINIRYAIMMAYCGLIMETEKYYRYTPFHFGWWRNIIACSSVFYKTGFSILKKNG